MNQTRTASEMLAQIENGFVALSFFFFLPNRAPRRPSGEDEGFGLFPPRMEEIRLKLSDAEVEAYFGHALEVLEEYNTVK